MKLANNVNLRVFCKGDEDKKVIVDKLKALLPFDLEKEKIQINSKTAEGFTNIPMEILSVTIVKERHVKVFLKLLAEKLGDEKKTLLEQATTRLDDDLNFFIRLDKDMPLKDKFVLTDSGKCYHIKINIAAFPKKLEKGLEVLKEIFK